MKEKVINLFKDHKTLIVSILSASFILFFSIFFMVYNSESNISKRKLKNIATELNNVNLSLEGGLKDFSIDSNKSYDVLVSGSNTLKELLNSILEIHGNDSQVVSIKTDLTNTINSTMDLYDSCISMLSNSKDIKSSDDLKNFISFKENCIRNYYILNKNNINISFPEVSIKFFDNVYKYLNTIIKINRDSQFQSKQQREFFMQLQSFNLDFDNLNQDLTLAINKVKEDNRDLQVIIDDIYKKEETYKNLKGKVLSLSIPDGYMDIYNSLNEYLNLYGVYLKSIKEAVIYEKTCSDVDKYSKEISKNYENAFSKRDDVLELYSSYENNF